MIRLPKQFIIIIVRGKRDPGSQTKFKDPGSSTNLRGRNILGEEREEMEEEDEKK